MTCAEAINEENGKGLLLIPDTWDQLPNKGCRIWMQYTFISKLFSLPFFSQYRVVECTFDHQEFN